MDALLGSPDQHSRVSGEAQLLVFDAAEGSFKARVNLNADDYHIAWAAHGDAAYVSLQGILIRERRANRIETVSHLKRLSD